MPPIPAEYYLRKMFEEIEAKKQQQAHGTPKADKVAHVKSQGQTREHHCHYPGCDQQVPPAMWGAENIG